MSQLRSVARVRAELVALEESVERARAALACVYSGAEEFEAAVIRAKRAQGAFDAHQVGRLRMILWVLVAAAAAMAITLLF
jgi:hypothetical protein